MTLLKTAALSAALFGAAGAGAGAAMVPAVYGQNTVRAVAPAPFQVISGSGRIGVTVSDLDPTGGKAATGVMVDEVEEDSPAARAGLKKGDVVVEFDGERVRSVRQFTRLVSETPSGREVAAAVLRDGQRVPVNVVTRETGTSRVFEDGTWRSFENLRDFSVTVPPVPARPAPPARAPRATIPTPRPPMIESFGFFRGNQLGVSVSGMSDQLGEYFGTKTGLLVNNVTEGSAAAKAGIKAGDVIVSVNGSPVETAGDIGRHLQKLESGDEFTVQVMRDRKSLTLKGKVEAPPVRRSRTIL
jgi:serine protease Do